MSNIRIVVDDEVLMDANPGTWTTSPPDINKLGFRGKGNQPEPWRQLILHTIAEAATLALAGKQAGNVTIEVATHADGWDCAYRTS